MLKKILASCVIMIVLVDFSYAKDWHVFIDGKCSKLTIKNSFFSSKYINKILLSEYSNGGMSLAFLAEHEDGATLVSFFGYQSALVQQDKSKSILPISKITFTVTPKNFKTKQEIIEANGKCIINDPFEGKPANISCTATTNQGVFVGEFISNGDTPTPF